MRKRLFVIAALIGVPLIAVVVVYLSANGGDIADAAAGDDPTTTIVTPEDDVVDLDSELTLAVDDSITPIVATVGPLIDGGPPREVGRIVFADGESSDLVLGELIVAVTSPSQLEGFLDRHDGDLLETFPGEDGEPDEHLVRLPVTATDPEAAALAMAEVEGGHAGEYRVSDPLLLTMMSIAATEQRDRGIEVSLNWVSGPHGIADGEVSEAPDRPNPFEWDYLRVGGPLDTGVTGAWQLIEHHGRSDWVVHVLVADGGFFENTDLPARRKARLAEWNVGNPMPCSGGSSCPTHGTDVALTAVGQIDNGYGTAGVAGQVGSLIVVDAGGDFWAKMRRIKRVVREEHPAVVNMSFGWEVKAFRAASQASADRHIRAMKRTGALVIAAAGNDGKDVDGSVCVGGNCFENRLFIPCESRYAVCIGGYQRDNPWLHEGSNRGTAGGSRSVEMYAPYCVVVPVNPVANNIPDTKWGCGTSQSAPFVTGAAALVEAADPTLSADEIWEILRETAHVGGVHFDHYIPMSSQLRLNVMDAVAAALGVEQTGPVVEITSPGDGHQLGVEDWLELDGAAVDFKGQPLQISWTSSIDGDLGSSTGPLTVLDLSTGTHNITATATDVNESTGSATITVEVVDTPPEMAISWPASGAVVYETEDIALIGSSEDPDTHLDLDDDDVEWGLLRNGQVVYGAQGHVAEVPAGTLQPGNYQVVFRGRDGGGTGEAQVTIHVLEVVGELPKAYITTDLQDEAYEAFNDNPIELELNGFGLDAEDGYIADTRVRWIARADNGHRDVLCAGSAFAEPDPDDAEFDPGLVVVPPEGPSGPGVIGVINECGTIEASIGLAPGAVGETVWALVFEVVDSDGQIGRRIVDVTVKFVTG